MRLEPASYIEPHLRLGEIAYMEARDDEALKELNPILSAHPQNTEARFILAKVYVRENRFGTRLPLCCSTSSRNSRRILERGIPLLCWPNSTGSDREEQGSRRDELSVYKQN